MRRVLISLVVAGCGFQGQAKHDAEPGARDSDVDTARAIDAPLDAPPDAPFMPASCPASYDQVIVTSPGSVYRFIDVKAGLATHHATCNGDHPGWTHLVVVNDMTEAAAVGAYDPTSYVYIGAVQQPGGTVRDAGWFRFDGAAVSTGWSPTGNQPDDADDVENGAENLAVVASTGAMHDVAGTTPYTAMCECDGRGVDPTVASYLP